MTVCLVMIVRNESAVIERCLRSALPHIQRWCIVDTGSTDDTEAVVERVLAGVPGQFLRRQWVNFGKNRTEAVALAREATPEAERASTWALLLDADHELVGEGFDGVLTKPEYTLLQRDGDLEYPNVRLLRLDREWACLGATHEYWPQPPEDTEFLASLWIRDHSDGGYRGNKLERDKALLLDDLAKDPKSERAVFYLGQTLEGLGEAVSLDLYRLRTSMGGYPDEAWLAQYRIGRILAEIDLQRIELGKRLGHEFLSLGEATAPAALLEAAHRNPSRAEPLWHLARFYRIAGRPSLAFMFAKRAKAIPKPKQGLFLEHWIYDVGIDQEIAISAYYAGDHLEGAAACERLENKGDAIGQANAFWYAAPLAVNERGVYNVPKELRTFDGLVYHCSNPSATELGEEVVHVVRLVGYTQERGRSYASLYPDGIIRTRNAILYRCAWHLLDDALPKHWNHAARILGLEDLRLCTWMNRVWFSATCCQAPKANGLPRVVIGRLSKDLRKVEHVVPIQFGGEIEKNWLLWPDGERLRCIYAFSPMTVLDLDPETGAATATIDKPWTHPGRFRGSAGPLLLGDDYRLAVTHDVSRQPDYNVYTHRFVAWRGTDLRVSSPFVLEHHGIEYCSGMDIAAGTVTLHYGVEDREARWADLPLDMVRKMLGI